MNQYGIDVNKLDEFVCASPLEKSQDGSRELLILKKEFSLERILLPAGKRFSLELNGEREAALFFEEGSASAGGVFLEKHEVISFAPGSRKELEAKSDSIAYVFFGPVDHKYPDDYGVKRKTTDYREKYWGSIETIVSKAYAGKRIFCRKGEHSSLEYHCRKLESYYIHSGKPLVRLRAGRAEDRFFRLPVGYSIFIPPGLMHQRGGLEDTVIIEISTHDDDTDSFLVEDGQKTKMPNL